MKGLFYPRTPTGKASIVRPVPWHYSGELITLEYRTDPAKVADPLFVLVDDAYVPLTAELWAAIGRGEVRL